MSNRGRCRRGANGEHGATAVVFALVVPSLRARRSERGAAAVEFALVVPVLLMILFGIITTGLTFSDHLSATNAVREAARYGAASDVGSANWATSVKDRLTQVYFNAGETVEDDQICVRLVQAGGTTPPGSQYAYTGANCGIAPTVPTNMAIGSCAVLVWMQRPQTIRLLVVPDLDFTTRAESVAYYSRLAGTTCTAL